MSIFRRIGQVITVALAGALAGMIVMEIAQLVVDLVDLVAAVFIAEEE